MRRRRRITQARMTALVSCAGRRSTPPTCGFGGFRRCSPEGKAAPAPNRAQATHRRECRMKPNVKSSDRDEPGLRRHRADTDRDRRPGGARGPQAPRRNRQAARPSFAPRRRAGGDRRPGRPRGRLLPARLADPDPAGFDHLRDDRAEDPQPAAGLRAGGQSPARLRQEVGGYQPALVALFGPGTGSSVWSWRTMATTR